MSLKENNSMLSSTVIGVELHRLGLKFRAVEVPNKKAGKKAPATGACRLLYIVNAAFFYTDQIFQTNLYPKKSAQVATNLSLKLNEIEMNGHFWVEKAENSITQSWFKRHNLIKVGRFSPKNT